MARIKFGMMMTDARGKLGGQVFTKTRSGATVRTKVTPVNPKTSFQGSVRNAFANISRRWALLDAEERNGWNAAVGEYAKTNVFGDTYLPSGKSLFQQINNNLTTAGATVVDTVPASRQTTLFDFSSADVNLSDGEINLTISLTAPIPASCRVIYEATAPNSPGRYNFSGQYRQFAMAPGSALITADLLNNAYIAKFGVPPRDKKISFRVYTIDNVSGLASPRATQDAIAHD